MEWSIAMVSPEAIAAAVVVGVAPVAVVCAGAPFAGLDGCVLPHPVTSQTATAITTTPVLRLFIVELTFGGVG